MWCTQNNFKTFKNILKTNLSFKKMSLIFFLDLLLLIFYDRKTIVLANIFYWLIYQYKSIIIYTIKQQKCYIIYIYLASSRQEVLAIAAHQVHGGGQRHRDKLWTA